MFDVGTFEDKVFIAMEYVEGNTVTYWLQVQQRGWKEILQVFMDAGRGLAAAHEKGLVHRDFKTDNVMVSRDRHVRVMDFGLARQVQEKSAPGAAPAATPPPASAEREGRPVRRRAADPDPHPAPAASAGNDGPPTMVVATDPSAPIPIEGRSSSGMFDARLTRTGAMMGTPAYMAPEQFLGTPTDARSDQFSFCIALYEALYGERPFEGSTMSTLTANVVQGNVRDAPAGSKVPLWVRKVLLRGLMPRAKDRWPSMEALIEALGKDPSVQRRKWLAAAGGMMRDRRAVPRRPRAHRRSEPGLQRRPAEARRHLGPAEARRAGARAPRPDPQGVHGDRQELRARRLRHRQPRAHDLRPELGEHVQGDLRGDARFGASSQPRSWTCGWSACRNVLVAFAR